MPTAMQSRPAAPPNLRSAPHYMRAQKVFPAGVTRATIERDPHPIYIRSGEGAYVTDIDGKRYLDLNNNFTTLIHGHCFAPVSDAVLRQVREGSCFANPTPHEIALAELLVERICAAERIRFVNTGTEAVMFAIKAARTFTGKPAIARFVGAYHGAYDWAEMGQNGRVGHPGNGSAASPGYGGQPQAVADDVILLDFNDGETTEDLIISNAGRLAAILVDPMPSRAGLLAPKPGFLARLSRLAAEHGILVIADEVLNLRQGYSGASPRYGLCPDLVTAGKIIGGGLPIGAICGRQDVMSVFGSSDGATRLSQGGTFSANPLSMVAGLAAMQSLQATDFQRLEALGDDLRHRLAQVARKHGARFCVNGAASLFRIHARADIPTRYADAVETAQQGEISRSLVRHFREHGILLPMGAAACLSTPMGHQEIDLIVSVFDDFLDEHPEWQEAASQ
nr:aspartate aminotransferase family protein [Allorhizobium pseudoryzae]